VRVHLISGLGCALMTASTLADAHQLDLGIGQSVRMESNIFGSATDPITDGTYRIIPDVNLSGSFDKFSGGSYEVSYQPSYLWYFRSEGVNGLDNKANGSAQIELSRRDQLSASASYTEYSSIQAISEANEDGSFDVLASDQGQTIRAFGSLGYSRSPDARSNLRLNLDFQDYGYTESRNIGNKSIGVTTSYNRAGSRRLTLGASVSARYRFFDEQQFQQQVVEGSTVVVTNINALATYKVTPNVVFDFQGGPSLIRTQPGSVVGRPKPETNSDFTYFMNMSLRRDFKNSNLRLNYVRNEDPSGGSSRTSVLDTLSIVLNTKLSELWRGSAIAGWSRRRTVDAFLIPDQPLPFSQETQLDRAWISLGVNRRLDERILLRLNFRYQSWIDYEVGGVKLPNQDNYTGSMTLNYQFSPYIF
jgi:hypothetical protein